MKKNYIFNRNLIMGHALEKESRLLIPARDKSLIAKPKPCLGQAHVEQTAKAAAIGMLRYEKALEKLSKV